MANELAAVYLTGATLKAQMAQAAAVINANIAMTEVGSSGYYTGTVPASSAGLYNVYITAAGIPVGVGTLNWDGAAEIKLPTVPASATNITAGVITTTTNLTNEVGKYQHGAVWIDTVNGAGGTTSYTNGIATNPSSSLASAKTIADNLKLKRFWIQSGSSITLAAAYVGYVFDGAGYTLALGGQDISKAIVHSVEGLSGTGICTTGEAVLFDCHISGATTIGEADFNRCHLMAGVTMSQATVPYLFNMCTGINASAKITFAAANQSAVISKWSGPLIIAGMVSTNTLFIDGDGDVTFDNTNNTGVVYINGAIRLTNNGATMNITDTSRWGEDQTIAVATTVAANGITATSIAADAINAAAVKADAVTKIQTGLATPTNITAGTLTTVTNLTNLPAITSNWLTAAGIAATALNGKGDWNVGKTGYALTQTFPTNFADLKIAVTSGIVDANVQMINDVTITGNGQVGTEFGV
jgi:hypothetical protein